MKRIAVLLVVLSSFPSLALQQPAQPILKAYRGPIRIGDWVVEFGGASLRDDVDCNFRIKRARSSNSNFEMAAKDVTLVDEFGTTFDQTKAGDISTKSGGFSLHYPPECLKRGVWLIFKFAKAEGAQKEIRVPRSLVSVKANANAKKQGDDIFEGPIRKGDWETRLVSVDEDGKGHLYIRLTSKNITTRTVHYPNFGANDFQLADEKGNQFKLITPNSDAKRNPKEKRPTYRPGTEATESIVFESTSLGKGEMLVLKFLKSEGKEEFIRVPQSRITKK